jgi:geranylgeranyl diphosphate synthase, type II
MLLMQEASHRPDVLLSYLTECRELVLTEIQDLVPKSRYAPMLYDLMLDYPLRSGKGFRPALCIATCRSLGGRIQDVLRTAAVLELYHNAFLLHDDVEDDSLKRRGRPTLHQAYGVPIAVNVGDALQALCLQPLLDNTSLLGLGKALHILRVVASMAKHSVEGQAVELEWVRRSAWEMSDHDYFLMSHKKSCWYTFIAPIMIGAIIGGSDEHQLSSLKKYATHVGLAFQIHDDVLNLIADEGLYGKEIGGDLWEGKRTLMLLHMVRSASRSEQERARTILERPRADKTMEDIDCLLELIHRHKSIDYAQDVARRLAKRSERVFDHVSMWMPPSIHRDFLIGMADHVIVRDK